MVLNLISLDEAYPNTILVVGHLFFFSTKSVLKYFRIDLRKTVEKPLIREIHKYLSFTIARLKSNHLPKHFLKVSKYAYSTL